MRNCLLIIITLWLAGCVPDFDPPASKTQIFGKPFVANWVGSGQILSNPVVHCESVKTNIALLQSDPNQIVITGTAITCQGHTYKLADRILSVRADAASTFENGVKVGESQDYIPDGEASWFSYKVDLPELGPGPFYITFDEWPAGTLSDVSGPSLDLNIGAKSDGSEDGFLSHLYPRQ
jgi:hypothetical protein